MNYEAAKRAAMRGEIVRRMSWARSSLQVHLDEGIWRFCDTGYPCYPSAGDRAATDWVIVRKRPRDVFTHPRRGDVIEHNAIGDLEVLAVAPEGVLWHRVGGYCPRGETRAEFASRQRLGWTVKTRAERKA